MFFSPDKRTFIAPALNLADSFKCSLEKFFLLPSIKYLTIVNGDANLNPKLLLLVKIVDNFLTASLLAVEYPIPYFLFKPRFIVSIIAL